MGPDRGDGQAEGAVIQRFLLALVLAAPALLQGAPRLLASEVEAWSDATFQRAFDERRFSGLAITVVQDDAVLFTRGYGYADFNRRLAMDPVRTRVRVGSITKTFTAMAVAQLVERKLIRSIDDPVNTYLRRDKLPKVDGKDITLRHLLTHTAGFDSRAFGLATERSFSLPLSAQQIQAQRPPIVARPGERSVYSNYGTAMLAVVVEDITGEPIERYFEEHLFRPLGMSDSMLNVTTQPSPNLAVPSRFLPSGIAQPQRFLGVHPFFAPVGAIESTPADMARYMIANLQEGRGESAAVLGPKQFRALHRRLEGNHAATSGFGMIFITFDWNGVTFFGHGGDWPGFHSIMFMSPQSNAGFFISCLCEYPQPGLLEAVIGSPRMETSAVRAVLEPMTNVGAGIAFLERFWGKRSWPAPAGHSDPANYLGTYWREFRSHDSFETFFDLLDPSSTLLIERDGQGALRINGSGGYGEISPGVFWNPQGEPHLDQGFANSGLWAFTTDASGSARYASPTFAIDAYKRSGSYANPRFAMKVLALCALLALTGVLAAFWPRGAGHGGYAKWLPPLLVGALIALALVLLAGYGEGDGPGTALLLGQVGRMQGIMLLANLVALGTLAMSVISVLAWRHRYWGHGARATARRVHFTVLTGAAIGITAVFGFVNFLGLRLP